MKKIKIQYIKLLIVVVAFCFSGCRKFVEVETPPNKTSTESAFKSDIAAAAVLTGLYAQLSNSYFYSITLPGTSFYEELSADNLTMFDVNSDQSLSSFYQNDLTPDYASNYGQTYWKNTYALIYTINAAIEGLKGNTDLNSAVSKRLLGEAYFMRAFCYFYLVNLYGDVPLSLSSDYKVNAQMSRSSTTDVYGQINEDLQKAEGLLTYDYVQSNARTIYSTGTEERIRPNLGAVNALQARAYLYQKNYSAAEAAATKVIDHNTLFSLGLLDNIFLKNSSETIWALQPVSEGFNTIEGAIYIIPIDGPSYDHPFLISASLKNTFEAGDNRKAKWLDSITIDNGGGLMTYVYPAKYKLQREFAPVEQNEYTIVLRLAEQYLIRAEARNEQGNTGGAADDLNAIRDRSRATATIEVPKPLPSVVPNLTKEQMKDVILHERRVELFTEWGHRWFDLKRSPTLDAVMAPATALKGGTWSNYKSLYPIPVSDIRINTALTQNPGYTK